MNKPIFVHNNVHSEYSIIDGLNKIKDLIKKTVNLKMPSLAITDYMNMFGVVKFYKTSIKFGIKPIIGVDCLIKDNNLNKNYYQLTILAKNNFGYKNLKKLISKSYKNGYKLLGPYIKKKWLTYYNNGLILLSGGLNGDIAKYILNKKKKKIKKSLNFYKKYFKNNFYFEINRIGLKNEDKYIKSIIYIAEKYSLPIVATNNVRFINKNQFESHKIRVAIHNKCKINNKKNINKYSSNQYLKSEKDMFNLFSDIPGVLKNSIEIARRCNVNLNLGKSFLPNFPNKNISNKDYLIKKTKIGLEKRLNIIYPDKYIKKKKRFIYDKRINYELKVINKIGFPSYFLIVMEFIKWAKSKNIAVGPGRGSGAGSLVAYSLNITEINPIKYDLLFERFLNLERISMPDFDIDFCMKQRDLVINHVIKIYGKNFVSQIITFGTLTAKAVIKDVGRVLGYSYNFVNSISKLIPNDLGITLKKSLLIEPKLKILYNSDEEIRLLIDKAKKLEGVVKNIGKHAGGVVISPKKIINFSPIYYDSNGKFPVTQFDKYDIEEIGLVKFDFLGLRTLTIINQCIIMINNKRRKLKKKNIIISDISLDDKKVFNLLIKADTTGIFQLESNGMKELIKKLKPDCFNDLIALVALFRPGPLKSGMVDNFIKRKHGLEKISYPDNNCQHKLLIPILKSTYGIILYQEQVMKIAQILAGYSLGEADILRRVISKKNSKEMFKQRKLFIYGSKKKGIKKNLSIRIFNLIEKFAGYGFNKSHSVAYALISYQTLWLKTYYIEEFMASSINNDIDNNNKIIKLLNECINLKIKIIPPDVNKSFYNFIVNKNKEILYGLGAIKGLGSKAINSIIKSREKYFSFKTIFDLCCKTKIKNINKRVLEKLIFSGSLDKIGPNRSLMYNSINNALKIASQVNKNKLIGQIDIFNFLSKNSEINKKKAYLFYNKKNISISDNDIFKKEKETIGLYLTSHPIYKYLNEIKSYKKIIKIKNLNNYKNKFVYIIGWVYSAKIINTKYKYNIGIFILDDGFYKIEVILFKKIFNKYKDLFYEDQILVIYGKINVNKFKNTLKMIAMKILDFKQARLKFIKNIYIFLNNKFINDNLLEKLFILLSNKSNLGKVPVFFIFIKNKKKTKIYLNKSWKIIINDKLLNDLYLLIGKKNIKLNLNI